MFIIYQYIYEIYLGIKLKHINISNINILQKNLKRKNHIVFKSVFKNTTKCCNIYIVLK